MTRAIAIAATVALLALAGRAPAEDIRLSAQANGSGACQAALPNFEGQIRKRPLAIQNEGIAHAFVSCSPASVQWLVMHPSLAHSVTLHNEGAATVTLSCTAVAGASGWPAEYMTRTVSVPGSGGATTLYFSATDLPQLVDNRVAFNLSCGLPPGTGIGTLYVNQMLQVAG